MTNFARWRWCVILTLGFLVCTIGPGIERACAQELSGTISYSGSHGPVSEERPLRLFLHADPYLDDQVDEAIVTTNGGAFQLRAPAAGTYYLGYILDVNNDDEANVGEPGEIYNNQLAVPGDPITVPQSGVNLDLGDTLLSGITGSVAYIGDEYDLDWGSELIVKAFSDPNLTDAVDEYEVESSGGRYDLITFDTSPRYLLAFLDLNGTGDREPGEPFEIYNGRATPPGDGIVASTDPIDINIVFGDELSNQRLTGTITYTGSRGLASREHPILMFMFNDPFPEEAVVDGALVSNNGGPFTLGAPVAGNYYLAYVLDLDANADASVGEPAAIYDGRATFPGDPLPLPQSGVDLSFGDAIVIRGIAGRTEYTGRQGWVSSETPIFVQAFSDSLLRFEVDDEEVEEDGARFDIVTLDTGTYYLRAFLDRNSNRRFDPNEPCEVYNNRPCGQGADPVVAGASQTAIAMVFGDDPPSAHLSGTITYSGSLGPVSNDKPIAVVFIDDDGEEDATTVGTNGGAFDLAVSTPGSYPLAYFLDVNNNGEPNLGEPFEIYNNRFDEPFDTIAVPQAGVRLDFDDTGILSGIAGTVRYDGQLGPVSESRRAIVEAFSDSLLRFRIDEEKVEEQGGGFEIDTLDTGTYYLRAFLDANGDGELGPGEPFEIYQNRGGPPGDPVIASPTQTAIHIAFGDENVVASCVGDCDQDGRVSVDELVRGVNIALGLAPVDDCIQFDRGGDRKVTVDELVEAVNNALLGCR